MNQQPKTAEPQKPRRHWFQFRLRTLFAVVAMLACWLAYETNWIRQRHALIQRERSNYLLASSQGMPDDQFHFAMACDGPTQPPGLLWVFRETGNSALAIIVASPTAEELTLPEHERIREAERLFPESSIVVISWKPGSRLSVMHQTAIDGASR